MKNKILIMIIIALVSISAYGAELVEFQLGNRQVVGTTYTVDLFAEVSVGQTWTVSTATLVLNYNKDALSIDSYDNVDLLGIHSELDNTTGYKVFQGIYSENDSLAISILSENNTATFTAGLHLIGTISMTIEDTTEYDNFDFVNAECVVYNGLTELDEGGTTTSDFTLLNPWNRRIKALINTPVPSLPVNHTTDVVLDATLDWNDILLKTGYFVRVSDDNTFGDIDYQTSVVNSTHNIPFGSLDYNTKYYWQVAAFNTTDTSYWSETYDFTTHTLLPPALDIPADNYCQIGLNPTFRWSAALGADEYQLQISSTNSFGGSDVVFDTTIAAVELFTTIQMLGLNEATDYWWRVCSIDEDDFASAWSTVRTFYTMITLDLYNPADEATSVVRNNAAFSWEGVTEATQYNVEISTTVDFNVPDILYTSYPTTNSLSSQYLNKNTEYFWRVRAYICNTYSVWSEISSLTTEDFAGPTLTAPADEATGIAIPYTMEWNSSTEATSYDFELSTVEDFATTIYQVNLATNSKEVSNLQYNTKYYWRVKMNNAHETSSWSDVYEFTTLTLTPPTLTAPADLATEIAIPYTMGWSSSGLATSYDFEISTVENFATTLHQVTPITNSYQVTDMVYSTKYYWRVKLNTAHGSSAWSDVYEFTTLTLAPPSLTAPADLATEIAIPYTMGWSSSGLATSYDFEISTVENFATTLHQVTPITNSYQVTDMVYSTKYYWRVKLNTAHGSSAWSEIYEFTTKQLLPPVLTAPTDLATEIAIPYTMLWEASSLATSYDFEIDDANDFLSTLHQVNQAGNSFEVDDMVYSTKYYWRVKTNTAHGISAWSDVYEFTTKQLSPPVLTAPADLATGVAVVATMQWEASSLATSYDFEIDDASDFLSTLHQVNQAGNSFEVDDMAYNTTYYWRVKTNTAHGISAWSDVYEFTTKVLLPPTLTSPLDEATGVAVVATMQWSSSLEATSYDFEIGDASDFLSPLHQVNQAGNSFEVDDMAYNTTYYWRAKINNSHGSSVWSEVFEFSTKTLLPPTLTTPVDNYCQLSTTPTFTWSTAANADKYEFEVATSSDFSGVNIVYSSEPTAATVTIPGSNSLSEGEEFFWRVRSLAGVSHSSTWSAVRSFTVVVNMTLTAPADDAEYLDKYSTTFSWENNTNVSQYQIQIATSSSFGAADIAYDVTQASNSYSPAYLYQSTEHFWRVRPMVCSQWGDWSSVYSFTTEILPAASLSLPADDATNVASDYTLQWVTVTEATSYDVQVSTSSTFGTTFVDDNVATNSLLVENMGIFTEYFWRVKVNNDYESSALSVVYSFRTAKANNSWIPVVTSITHTITVPTSITPNLGARDIAADDYIGVFYDDSGVLKCAGEGKWNGSDLDITVYGDNPATPEKDGFDDSEDFNFKFWDALAGTEIEASATIASGDTDFATNGATTLATLEAGVLPEHEIYLGTGWNLISSYLTPENDSIKVVASTLSNLLVMKNGAGSIYLPPTYDFINTWNDGEAYQVYVTAMDTLVVTGTAIAQSFVNSLSSGWNMFAYTCSREQAIGTALATINANLLVVKDPTGKIYIPGSYNFIGNLKPGEGYRAYLTTAVNLVYPTPPVLKTTANHSIYSTRFEEPGINNETVILSGNLTNGTEVIAYNSNDLLVGSGKFENGTALVVLYADDEYTDVIDGAREGENIRFTLLRSNSNYEQAVELSEIKDMISNTTYSNITYKTDGFIQAKIAGTNSENINSDILTLTPNPANTSTELSINLTDEDNLTIELYSNDGKKLDELYKGEYLDKLSIATQSLASGTYQILVKTDDNVEMIRLLIVK